MDLARRRRLDLIADALARTPADADTSTAGLLTCDFIGRTWTPAGPEARPAVDPASATLAAHARLLDGAALADGGVGGDRPCFHVVDIAALLVFSTRCRGRIHRVSVALNGPERGTVTTRPLCAQQLVLVGVVCGYFNSNGRWGVGALALVVCVVFFFPMLMLTWLLFYLLQGPGRH
jgi:hypothetical protein